MCVYWVLLSSLCLIDLRNKVFVNCIYAVDIVADSFSFLDIIPYYVYTTHKFIDITVSGHLGPF